MQRSRWTSPGSARPASARRWRAVTSPRSGSGTAGARRPLGCRGGGGGAAGPPRGRKGVAARHLATVGLGDRGDRLPLELSGGEQQRVAIARAMACGPPILLGDEPTGNLDTGLARDMFELLKGLNGNGTTVVYVTHDQALEHVP